MSKKKFLAILSYFGILVVIPLIVGKKDEFILYHAKEGTILLFLWIVLLFIAWLPVLGTLLAAILLLFNLVCVALGVVNVVRTVDKPIPIVGARLRPLFFSH